MKKLIVVPVLAIVAFASIPTPSYALSCIDPEGMIEHIVSNPDYVVVTATPTEQAERVKEAATKDDPNQMYNSGYTGQFIEVSKAHMGTVPDSQWVYFHRDGTWNYLCAGAPPKVKSENIYVISIPASSFDVQTVVATYPADSSLAKELLKAIADEEEVVEPTIYEVPKSDWLTRLHDELKEMAFLVEVKLAEWKYWLNQ